jgi:hypothetical protein
MMRFVLLSLLALAISGQHMSAQRPDGGFDDPSKPVRWFATFSIIAFDPATNDLGVAVQSHAFGAGAAVPYAIPGVGAVATQAAANRLYGPKAIELLKHGLSPADVVKRLTEEDPGRDTRQLAVIDGKDVRPSIPSTRRRSGSRGRSPRTATPAVVELAERQPLETFGVIGLALKPPLSCTCTPAAIAPGTSGGSRSSRSRRTA